MEEVGKKEINLDLVFQVFGVIGVIYISQMVYITLAFVFDKCAGQYSWLSSSVGLLLAMGLPYLIYKDRGRLLGNNKNGITLGVLLSLLATAVVIIYDKTPDIKLVILMIFVALNEELFYRGVIQKYFEKHMNVVLAVTIQSLLFAFLNHSTETFLDNFLIRFPIALVLTMISKKYGLLASVLVHFIYNIIQF